MVMVKCDIPLTSGTSWRELASRGMVKSHKRRMRDMLLGIWHPERMQIREVLVLFRGRKRE
jgi:hypothetical protein